MFKTFAGDAFPIPGLYLQLSYLGELIRLPEVGVLWVVGSRSASERAGTRVEPASSSPRRQ